MNSIFKDSELQKKFDKAGYLTLSLLREEEVNQLREFYSSKQSDKSPRDGFHISLDETEKSEVVEIQDTLIDLVQTELKTTFDNHTLFTASFVVKEPGKKFIVPPHQDWSFVDESEHYSATIWVPLQDVDENNGALGVIPGSHKLFDFPRSSPSPESKSALSDHIFTLFPYVQVIELKAGQALVFDNRLIHASPPNLSAKSRIALGVGIKHKDAQLIHYYQLPEIEPETLVKYEVSPPFFTTYDNKRLSHFFKNGQSIPDQKEISRLNRPKTELSSDELRQLVEALPDSRYNQELMDKLAAIFGYNQSKVNEEEAKKEEVEENPVSMRQEQKDFFNTYTPLNIYREIIWRLRGRPQ